MSIEHGLVIPKRTKKQAPASKGSGGVPETYVMTDQVGFLMRVAMQRHTTIFMSLMPHGLTQPQFAVLAKLVEIGTCSQNELGRLVYLDAATIKGVVRRLNAKKLVTTKLSPKDRRRSMIVVTKLGERIAAEAIAVAHQVTRQTLAPLRSTEQRQVVRLLQKMI